MLDLTTVAVLLLILSYCGGWLFMIKLLSSGDAPSAVPVEVVFAFLTAPVFIGAAAIIAARDARKRYFRRGS